MKINQYYYIFTYIPTYVYFKEYKNVLLHMLQIRHEYCNDCIECNVSKE